MRPVSRPALRLGKWSIAVSPPRRSAVRPPGLARTGPLRDALRAIGVGSVVVAAIEIGLLLHQPFPDMWPATLFPVVGVVYVAAGLLAWARRPSSRLGLLILAGGWASMLAGVGNIDAPATLAIGAVTATLILAVVAHLLVGFPTGRLKTPAERGVVVAGYVVCLVLQLPLYLYRPGSPLTVRVDPDLAQTGADVQRWAGAAVVLAICVLLVGRMRRAGTAQRRVLAPLAVYGIVALVYTPVSSYVWNHLIDLSVEAQFVAQMTVLGLVPVAFVLAASRGGFERTGDVAELGVWLGAELGRAELRDALAATLGDPSVELLFRLSGEDGLVDHLGMPAGDPASAHGRGMVDVELDGRTVGAIVYDARLLDRPDEVRAAGRVVALALDRERLTVALRASRARIVAASDGERRRIARDLHDGLQSRLVSLGIQVGTGADPAALGASIQAAIDDLRELVDGVMPAQLTQRGLVAAVEELIDRVPAPIVFERDGLVRLAPGVETAAYFVVSEAVVNAVKHADAATIDVSLEHADGELWVAVADDGCGGARRDGGGLRGMTDRVEALGGRLVVDSPVGGGTRVRAVIPCGS